LVPRGDFFTLMYVVSSEQVRFRISVRFHRKHRPGCARRYVRQGDELQRGGGDVALVEPATEKTPLFFEVSLSGKSIVSNA
jgi:hypothetical protein